MSFKMVLTFVQTVYGVAEEQGPDGSNYQNLFQYLTDRWPDVLNNITCILWFLVLHLHCTGLWRLSIQAFIIYSMS